MELKNTSLENDMTITSSDMINSVQSGDITRFKECFEKMIADMTMNAIQNRTSEIMCSMNEEESAEAEAGPKIDGGEDDTILADPSMSKEYFVKRIEHDNHEIVFKKLGLGPTKPIVVHIDGKRWELFPGPKSAEREAKKYVESMKQNSSSESEKA